MADESYTASSSVVSTRPRVREQVREELREDIRLLELNRVSAAEKLRLERDAVERSAGEVELFEKGWRRGTSETLSEIERSVDALGTEAPRAPPARAAPSATAPDLTPAPAPTRAPRGGAKRLAPADQRAIAKHLGGQVQRADVLFATTRGRVVEVELKKQGEVQRVTVLVSDAHKVATLDDIGQKLDALPLPARAPAPPGEPAPPESLEGLTRGERQQPIEATEGIGPAFGRKLRGAGVTTLGELLQREPGELAEASGIEPKLVRKWHAQGTLQAVNGIGPQFSELLVRAGIGSLEALAAQQPAALARRLNDYEARLGVRVQGRTITPEMTGDWVRQARLLRPPAPAPAAEPERVEEEEAEEATEEAPAPRKKFGLKLGRKPTAEEAEDAVAEPAPEPAAETQADPAPTKKFGLSFGRKKEAAPADAAAPPEREGAEEPKRKFGLRFRK
jgi:predicted flap endonuclease-1-like 5' DNA nuclease